VDVVFGGPAPYILIAEVDPDQETVQAAMQTPKCLPDRQCGGQRSRWHTVWVTP